MDSVNRILIGTIIVVFGGLLVWVGATVSGSTGQLATIAQKQVANDEIHAQFITALESLSAEIRANELSSYNRYEQITQAIEAKTDDRFTRREAELNFELIEARRKLGLAELKNEILNPKK